MRRDLSFRTLWMMCSIIGFMASAASAQPQRWQTSAKWHRAFKKPESGLLMLNAKGMEFRLPKFSRHWKYVDIHRFDLSHHELNLLTYENRHWHEPVERPFRFTLSETMPSGTTAQFIDRVGKLVRNGAPTTTAATIQEIPGHRSTWSGGSNGLLRLNEDGIDYVTENERDSRSRRWADIQPLANPYPYEFRVTAFTEIVEFDLKRPLARDVFEKLWDLLYAAGLNISVGHEEIHLEIPQ